MKYFAIKTYLNFKFKKVLKVLELKFDPKNDKIYLSLQLKGENEPLIVNIDKFELIEKENKKYLKLSNIKTNKEWLNIIVEQFVDNNHFEISDKIFKLLKLV